MDDEKLQLKKPEPNTNGEKAEGPNASPLSNIVF